MSIKGILKQAKLFESLGATYEDSIILAILFMGVWIMDLRKLKNYLGKVYDSAKRKSCYLILNDYVISDTYSIVCLKNNYGLNVVEEKDNSITYNGLKDYLERFKNETRLKEKIDVDFNEDLYEIDNDYSISIKALKEIKNLIKANNFEILEIENYWKYIIKIENTKTYEIGYLLPCRKH